MNKTCAVCSDEIKKSQSHIHHARLNVDVHMSCPMDNVRGEDIRFHTVVFHFVREENAAENE